MRSARPGTIFFGLLLLLFIAARALPAQQSSTPQLHNRSVTDGVSDPRPDPASANPGDSTLPFDASGSYHFDRDNESIELDLDRNGRSGHTQLSGYISRLGDAETDRNTPLTYFFDKTSIDGSQLEFQTRVLHGLWYSFHGTILRGDAQARAQDGYYVLHGTLLEHHPAGGEEKSADETIEKRIVSFKSMGR